MLQNQVSTTHPLKALNIEKNTRLLNQHKEKTSIFKKLGYNCFKFRHAWYNSQVFKHH